ncbi:MAG: DUF6029 family protein [Salibacteraceae bacterium]
MKLRNTLLLFFVLCFFQTTFFAQNQGGILDGAEIHGNFDLYAQQYNKDSIIGAPIVPEKSGINAFTNLIVTKGKFSAGTRIESYMPPVQGFDPRFGDEPIGIPFRYASFNDEKISVTAGNFYEQFGNGLILRSYEERGLGLDNAFDGLRVVFNPIPGVYLKGLVGNQRYYWQKSAGIVRAFDGELQLNELFPALSTSPLRMTIGGSFVSKFQRSGASSLVLPENVGGGAGRIQLNYKGFGLMGEFAYKENDPNQANHYIYREGKGIFLSATYSTKGFGINISAKSIDNMEFRSDRQAGFNDLFINYLPALTRQHTYNLAATLYPYATQPNGEIGIQGDLIYKIPRGSKVGGKYGTTIQLNVSMINSMKRNYLVHPNQDTAFARLDEQVYLDEDPTREGYKVGLLDWGNEIYYRDFNIEIDRKLTKNFKLKASYIYQDYNIELIQNKVSPNVQAHIAVLEGVNKLARKHSIRWEAQHLMTEQDQGDWIFGLIEYGYSPHWIITVLNQYNYGNKVKELRVNYPTAQVTYVWNAHRFSLGYGRQRAGIFCVGGVCRNVPAANGLTVAITSSF